MTNNIDSESSSSNSKQFLSTGGSVVSVDSSKWQTISSLIYPGADIAAQNLEPKRAWITAQAGNSATGIELVIEDNMGNVIAGPSTTFGGSVLQLMALMPLRTGRFRTRGPPQVLLLRARNRASSGLPSYVGQLTLELGPK